MALSPWILELWEDQVVIVGEAGNEAIQEMIEDDMVVLVVIMLAIEDAIVDREDVIMAIEDVMLDSVAEEVVVDKTAVVTYAENMVIFDETARIVDDLTKWKAVLQHQRHLLPCQQY